jgi:hypothetical protein
VYIGFGVGGAGLLVGAVTGVLSLSKAGNLSTSCPHNSCPPGDPQDSLDSAKTTATISTIGFIVGAVGVGVGVAALVLGGSSGSAEIKAKAKAPVRIQPQIGLGRVGVIGEF